MKTVPSPVFLQFQCPDCGLNPTGVPERENGKAGIDTGTVCKADGQPAGAVLFFHVNRQEEPAECGFIIFTYDSLLQKSFRRAQ